jgi:DNA polymerase III epsilon subunit-like protein
MNKTQKNSDIADLPLIFLDTETTGLDKEKDEIIQLAYKVNKTKNVVNELFNPNMEIPIDAMVVSHITDEMVANKKTFVNEIHKNTLTLLLDTNILIAHNAKFDIGFLEKYGVIVKWFIDTQKVARSIIDSYKYNLQYLRYFLKLNKLEKKKINPHDALSDIIVLENLFWYLFDIIKGDSIKDKLANMINISKNPVLIKKISFGKYKGETIEQISKKDRQYLEWLLKQQQEGKDKNDDLIHTINYYLN